MRITLIRSRCEIFEITSGLQFSDSNFDNAVGNMELAELR